jgi:chlorophyllase
MSSSSVLATVTTNVFVVGKCTTVARKVESTTTCSAGNTSPLLPVTPRSHSSTSF